MNPNLDDALRLALSDLAKEAQPVNIAHSLVKRAQRRQTVMTVAAAGFVVATLAIGTPLALAAVNGGTASTPGDQRPSACPSGRAVDPAPPASPVLEATGSASVPSESSPPAPLFGGAAPSDRALDPMPQLSGSANVPPDASGSADASAGPSAVGSADGSVPPAIPITCTPVPEASDSVVAPPSPSK